ncbi:MAG TPA: co-chaperone GroES [Patescibacteria group bacterium]|nr:co-chaperone GroES [Patescibacteria group bacterium]
MAAPIQPRGEYVLVQQEAAESKTASGLYLPEGAKEKPKIAKVLAVGSEVKDIKAGDRIVYGGYSNEDVKIDGKEYILIKLENVYATFNK